MAAWSPTWVTYSAENQKGKEFMGMGCSYSTQCFGVALQTLTPQTTLAGISAALELQQTGTS